MASPTPLLAHLGSRAHGCCSWQLGTALSGSARLRRAVAYWPGVLPRGQHRTGAARACERPRAAASKAAPIATPAESRLAGVPVPAQDETKHFKLIGTTGTGKSTAIGEILSRALARGDRAVIADPDGGYLQRFYRPDRGDVVLNPFDQRSVKWDLFAEIKKCLRR